MGAFGVSGTNIFLIKAPPSGTLPIKTRRAGSESSRAIGGIETGLEDDSLLKPQHPAVIEGVTQKGKVMDEIIKLIEARQRSPYFALWLIGSLFCLGAAAVGVWQILLNLYRLSKFAIGSPGVAGAELARSDLGETPDRNSALIAELIAEENSSLAAELIAEINECPPTEE